MSELSTAQQLQNPKQHKTQQEGVSKLPRRPLAMFRIMNSWRSAPTTSRFSQGWRDHHLRRLQAQGHRTARKGGVYQHEIGNFIQEYSHHLRRLSHQRKLFISGAGIQALFNPFLGWGQRKEEWVRLPDAPTSYCCLFQLQPINEARTL